MFVFLGLPGVVLAAFLAAYAGHILASTQRREQANLRLRGADRRQLGRVVGAQALAVAIAGSLAGTALGLAAVAVILGRHTLFAASAGQLAVSGLIAVVVGVVAIGLALLVPGRRALRREIADERRELALDPAPAWRRWRLDLVLVVVALVAGGVALAVGAFDAPSGSVTLGQAVSLPSYLLLAPLVAWVGGTLLSVRVLQLASGRLPVPAAPRFGSPVRGLLTRSLRRRSWTLGTAMAGLGLVVAFGVNLAVFASTYDAAKAADARYVVGSDLRITPSVLSGQPHPPELAARYEVPGVVDVAPVVFQLQNGVLIGPYDQDRADLAAVDPARFAQVAALSDSFFLDGTAAEAMRALAATPNGVLVRADLADQLSVDNGDDVQVLLARGTEQQTLGALPRGRPLRPHGRLPAGRQPHRPTQRLPVGHRARPGRLLPRPDHPPGRRHGAARRGRAPGRTRPRGSAGHRHDADGARQGPVEPDRARHQRAGGPQPAGHPAHERGLRRAVRVRAAAGPAPRVRDACGRRGWRPAGSAGWCWPRPASSRSAGWWWARWSGWPWPSSSCTSSGRCSCSTRA